MTPHRLVWTAELRFAHNDLSARFARSFAPFDLTGRSAFVFVADTGTMAKLRKPAAAGAAVGIVVFLVWALWRASGVGEAARTSPATDDLPVPFASGEKGDSMNSDSGDSSSRASAGMYNELTRDEARVILHKGTERAFTGEYTDLHDPGTYICRQCNSPLYRSEDKFESHCGWPSFEDEIPGAVDRHRDADFVRTEIVCRHCGGHLGHVFFGEGMTQKDTRHCVNSISMRFIPKGKPLPEVIQPKK